MRCDGTPHARAIIGILLLHKRARSVDATDGSEEELNAVGYGATTVGDDVVGLEGDDGGEVSIAT